MQKIDYNIFDKNKPESYPQWLERTRESGGMLLMDKGLDWTSYDIVAKLKSITNIKKIGHAGTLDPRATGLLIVCLSKGTKQLTHLQTETKKYKTTIKLGAVTKTYDSEAEEEDLKDISSLKEQEITSAINSFLGKTMQTAPAYSAKKFSGVPAYKLARENIEVKIEPVEIEITLIENISYDLPYVSFDVECSKGTYIRSLAYDIGKKLGSGAYLTELRRTKIGSFSVENALTIQEMMELKKMHVANNQ